VAGATRVWSVVAVVCATLGIGALLPRVPAGGIGTGEAALALAPSIRPAPAASPVPAAASAWLSRSVPVRVEIPALDVRAPVVPVGLARDASVEVPAGTSRAGWYDQSPTPGEQGPSVLVAHVDWAGRLGVFHDIRNLDAGDTIRIARQDGSVATFRIDGVRTYPKTALPFDAIFGSLDHPGLRLITCGGDFDEATGQYVDNVVAYASLI
jgi:LPXTG-site transpeptidase (sortase) family protein